MNRHKIKLQVRPARRRFVERLRLQMVIQLLNPGGVLLTFSCSGLMTTDLFQKIIADAAIDAGRDVQFIEQFRQAADHPVIATYPEGL
ncbi:hypothetical protein, partial [Acinetobacter junii]|uniref:hypothetical protein n=1 Tax=Acinetobacter junii TaxID=40215 RepID=UPI001C07C971